MINRERLGETFKMLVEIDSVSKEEANVSREIRRVFESLGGEITVDDSKEKTGSNTGNLIIKFKGNGSSPPMMLNAHMDTVEPGRGITPIYKEGLFTSDGSTILGADDKSAVAILIEAMRALKENSLPFCPLELVFTVCEEIGLLGAKGLNYDLLDAKFGYSLDAGNIDAVVTRAPAANRFEIKIHGKEAHAGASPEEGINAISICSKAIAGLTLGRIDHETTCNIGLIRGGAATNIIPNLVSVKGEVRSHDEAKLEKLTNEIIDSFKNEVLKAKAKPDAPLPEIEINLKEDFSRTFISDDHQVVRLARKAGEKLGRSIVTAANGGGSDANVFFKKGITTGVLGTGMTDIHSVRENVKLDDMVKAGELLLEIIKEHTRGES